ncbi:hypothetical protein N788_01395 [Arenimonas donghaensis DSM 18148 = HO3-R19]|uniref:DUF3261 domain-containing protein n=2 Tax=Arenimonas TaxID=490567 RepID=A0A087MLU7_9GAMM|nr:hypothetical protein N788_01395 [Arenimonas donghaensis DSM 18148 = HO3-R19]
MIALAAAALLAACSTQPPRAVARGMPSLQLAPSSLGGTLALQQRLVFTHGQRSDTVDALLEADADSVRVVLHQHGQVMLRLVWDGESLRQDRAAQLPEALSAQRVLDDLQLVHWPAPAIRAALPPGWQLLEAPGARHLLNHGETVASVSWPDEHAARLDNHREGYRLDIRSAAAQP